MTDLARVIERAVEIAVNRMTKALEAVAVAATESQRASQPQQREQVDLILSMTDAEQQQAAVEAFMAEYGADEWDRQVGLALRRLEMEQGG